MTRTELINLLLARRGGTRYLEIGVHREEHNFAHVHAAHKVGVDPQPGTTFHGSSDHFFLGNTATFDVIFVDGLHTERQVSRDIDNAYRCLSPGGAIVLHDCLPPDAWHQRGPRDFKEGEDWNGAVWKAALREFNRTRHKCVIVDTDWGCGVIDTARRQVPARRALPQRLQYDRHYPLLRDYVVSPSGFLRDCVRVFYHLGCIGPWTKVFAEQTRTLRASGFEVIDLTVLGTDADLDEARAICSTAALDARVRFHSSDLARFETPAMAAIETYARDNQGFVLYLHSKGVSSATDDKAKWRHLMMRELVENWERCVLELSNFDAIGVNWRDMPPVSHFCGNFWYASTRYLRTLASFQSYYDHPRYQTWDPINDKRLGCEFWIGSADAAPNVLSLVCRNQDFCNPRFWMSEH